MTNKYFITAACTVELIQENGEERYKLQEYVR